MNMITGKSLYLSLFLLFLIPFKTSSQTNIYNINDKVVYHPDGKIGKISFHTMLKYYSVSKDPQYLFEDIGAASAGFIWVPLPKLSVNAQVDVIKEDSTCLKATAGFSYYLKNPLVEKYSKNPDGITKSIVLSIAGQYGRNANSNENSCYSGIFTLIIPFSKYISLDGGYQHYDKKSVINIRQAFMGLRFYTGGYRMIAYVNPDGPPGNMAMHIKAGSSVNGYFTDVILLFPLTDKLTLRSEVTYQKEDYQNKKSSGGGIGFSFYP